MNIAYRQEKLPQYKELNPYIFSLLIEHFPFMSGYICIIHYNL